ncbi:MAG: hypothetical protein JST89_06065 [Cyanobacteria bacterium SZAS-4]|nr:hypothetical protein [Cyanobacteria bacterium SZAS-4]
MAAFGMQNIPVEGFQNDNTQSYQWSGGWNVDMRSPGDSRFACNRNNTMPSEFGSPFELYDSSQSQSPMSQFERDMQFQMRMMMQIMDRFMQYMEALLKNQMGDQGGGGGGAPGTGGGGDSQTGSGSSGGDSGHHCHHADGGTKPVHDGGTKPGHDGGGNPSNGGGTKPGNDGGINPGHDGGTKPGNDGGTKPGHDNNPPVGDDGAPRFANTGVQRGRTIYRDDFSGSKGEHPNSNVFDTQHIGPDGKTRQRGPSIHEDAMISDANTVMDGKGHLQLFADKQRTFDPESGEYVNYTKGSLHTAPDAANHEKGLTFNLKDYPNGIVIETRAKHPTNPGAKFDALWIMTDHWAADPAKGEKKRDTIEYDAAEGGGAGITVHYPVKEGDKSVSYTGGYHHMDLEDGKFHTYTVAISHNGNVVQYVDGEKVFSQKDVFPTDKDLHLKASLEVSPQWTHKKYTGDGGMNSDGAGIIDYLDVSELKP